MEESRAMIIEAIDGMLCATAIVSKLTVATRNVADFSVSGVQVYNPWQP